MRPSKEVPRVSFDELGLPVLEHDVPRVLHAGAVLREEAGEVSAVEADDRGRALPGRKPADTVCWETAAEEGLGVSDDLAVAGVQEDPQPIAAAGTDDVSIAEIEAEKLRVVPLRKHNRLARRAPASWTDRSERLSGLILHATPVAHCRPRHCEASRHLAVVLPLLDEGERVFPDLVGMHERMFAPASDRD